MNGDGNSDVVLANYAAEVGSSNGLLGVLLGNGDGTFRTITTYSSGGYTADSVAVADVNGDGKPDMLVANFYACNGCSNGSVGVLLGNGDGTFQAVRTYSSGGAAAYSLTVADINGDGKPDLVVANACNQPFCDPNTGVVGVLLGNGDGTFQTAAVYGSGGSDASSVVVADVNGDGKPDVLVANGCGTPCNNGIGSVGVLLGNGDGTFQPALSYGSSGQNAYSISVADVNGDGKPDVVLANWCASSGCNNGSVSVLLGNGDGTFQTSVTYSSGGYYANSVSLADVNGDGKPDIIVANNCQDSSCATSGTVGVLLGDGDGTFQAAAAFGSGGNGSWSVVAADVSGDGKPDILVANNYSSTVGILINTSSAATTTALISSVNPSVSGKPVTFTATVSSAWGGTPMGKIQFLNDESALATKKLISGSAKYTTSKLSPGVNTITAVYGGDSIHSGSASAPVNQIVLAASTTTLTSIPNPSKYGQGVIFTAVVTSSIGSPPDGEVVSFMKGRNVLGTGTLSSGTAIFATSTLKVGTTTVKAVYGGDSTLAGSASSAVKQVVKKALD